jgi:ABC-type uncharacterized transport system substrate-binding protein
MQLLNRTRRLALGTLLAVVLGLTGSALADAPDTFAEAKAQAAEENKVLIVDFYTDW